MSLRVSAATKGKDEWPRPNQARMNYLDSIKRADVTFAGVNYARLVVTSSRPVKLTWCICMVTQSALTGPGLDIPKVRYKTRHVRTVGKLAYSKTSNGAIIAPESLKACLVACSKIICVRVTPACQMRQFGPLDTMRK